MICQKILIQFVEQVNYLSVFHFVEDENNVIKKEKKTKRSRYLDINYIVNVIYSRIIFDFSQLYSELCLKQQIAVHFYTVFLV